ncbi:hypothetical protein KMZ29_16080 [Bradyrhizobium sediminis]|uniref:Uncharacterized protein n=1 Tax=Bradyrhizobium sediminis TaxID=2840469 RepID=A0A975NAK8_9BRAD|nr:hypothetical protein [Bradyrhizobium sediminis]QWG11270.1 hypothetical protein KMZ29_16080 [Bradyrhizobium sediminis]
MAEGQNISLYYKGSLNPSTMEARELIQVLSAFTRLTTKANRAYHGSTARTSVRIERVQPGSLDLQWIHEVAANAQTAFAALPALSFGIKDVAGLIKAWLDLLKFLKGQPPQKVQNVTNGTALQLENVSGQTTIVNGNVYNTFILNGIGTDAEKLELPAKHGAEKLELKSRGHRIGSYSKSDLSNFKPIKPKDKPIESEIEAILEVVAPVLEGDGMWRFKYGRTSITAKLTDEDYRQRVIDGEESFSHGDRLHARLKTIQENLGDKISTKHFVTKVLQRK